MTSEIQAFYMESFEESSLKEHIHNYYEIVFIKEGTADFRIGQTTYSLSKNTLVFISNVESHEIMIRSYPYERYYVLIDPKCFQKDFSDPVLQSIFKQRPDGFQHVIDISSNDIEKIESILTLMKNEYNKKDIFDQEVLNAYLILLLITIFRWYPTSFPMTNAGKPANVVYDIQKYIEKNFREDITLEEISNLFYINMYYLSHLFKKFSGFNFRQYLILQRISCAKELLLYTEKSVTEVAQSSGFNNVNHFIRIFKRSENITPFQYRKKLRILY